MSYDVAREAHHAHWLRLVALVARQSGDPALAEDAVSAAFEQAMETWPRDGVPESVFAWLLTAARRRAIDAIRQETARTAREETLARLEADVADADQLTLDDEARMLAACAPPGITTDSAACAMLRFVADIPADQLATAWLTTTPTMAARLTRAKKALAQHRSACLDLTISDIVDRLPAMRHATHLLWTLGHTGVTGNTLTNPNIAHAALRLARVIADWADDSESHALAATCEYGAARWHTRHTTTGQQHTLENAPRDHWDQDLIATATARLTPLNDTSGPYRWRAEIDHQHTATTWSDTNWAAIITAYDHLLTAEPDAITALGRCVAMSYHAGPEAGLTDLADVLELPAAQALLAYPYTYAAQADMHRRAGNHTAATTAYQAAANRARNTAERNHFTQLATECDTSIDTGTNTDT